MLFRLSLLLSLLMTMPAVAQQRRIDVLTGEPYRAPSGRPEPEIVNAPHAPRQVPAEAPPLDIYVAPQMGESDTGPGQSLRRYRREAQERREPRWRRPIDPRSVNPIDPDGPRVFDRIHP